MSTAMATRLLLERLSAGQVALMAVLLDLSMTLTEERGRRRLTVTLS